MSNSDGINIPTALQAIFDAERSLRDTSEKLLHAPHGPLLQELERGILAAQKLGDEAEAALRLVCLSRVLRGVPGNKPIDLLIDILGSDNDEARAAAGIAMEDICFDRKNELMRGIERATTRLKSGNLALAELPYVILQLPEVDVLQVLRPFLGLKDAEAVAATIEVLVELSDPTAIELLKPLQSDKRTVQMDDESSGATDQISIGAMASDAIEALQEVDKIMQSSED